MVSHKDHFEEPNLHIKSRRLKRIIDGEFATLSEFPSSALLYQSSNVMEFRGAVIVGSRHVITHERCVYGVNANDCRITVGVLSPLSESSMTTKGEEQIERKTYIGMNISRNSHSQIAVIKTVKDIKFGDHVKPAKVPWTDLCLISPGQSYKIQGAGAASETFDENVDMFRKMQSIFKPSSDCHPKVAEKQRFICETSTKNQVTRMRRNANFGYFGYQDHLLPVIHPPARASWTCRALLWMIALGILVASCVMTWSQVSLLFLFAVPLAKTGLFV